MQSIPCEIPIFVQTKSKYDFHRIVIHIDKEFDSSTFNKKTEEETK